MTTQQVAEYLGLSGPASARCWLRRHGIPALSRQPGSRGQNLYPVDHVVNSERRVYDRWRDMEGTPIAEGCRVQQVAVHRPHGGAHARLGQHALVIERHHSRVHVRFDGEQPLVSIRPYLLRVVPVTSAAHDGEEDPHFCLVPQTPVLAPSGAGNTSG